MQKFALLGLIVTVGCISQTYSAKAGEYVPTDGEAPTTNTVTCDTATAEAIPAGLVDENNPPPNNGNKTVAVLYGRTFKWVPAYPGEPPANVEVTTRFHYEGSLVARATGRGSTAQATASYSATGRVAYNFSPRDAAIGPLGGNGNNPYNTEVSFVSQNNTGQFAPNTGDYTIFVTPSRVDLTATASADANGPNSTASASASGVKVTIVIEISNP